MTNPRLEELRGKFQENPRRYFAPYANELRKTGDPAQAIAVCRTHLAGQPAHVSGHIVLGQALYEAGEPIEARDVFTTALELDPENLIALRSLGEIAQVNGEFGAARQWYQRLLDADPRNTEVAQLLRDIPSEAPSSAPEVAAATEPVEEPTPFTVREEIAAAEAPAEPATQGPRFHTSYSGSGPAYKTAEDQREEAAAQASAPAEDTDSFVDLQPTAHDSGASAPPQRSEWAPPAAEAESLDMVDFEEEAEAAVAEASPAALPDESFDFAESHGAEEFSVNMAHEERIEIESDADHEPVAEIEPYAPEATQAAEPEFIVESMEEGVATSGPVESLEIEDFAGDALDPGSAAYAAAEDAEEPPRAMFAERGFDGPVNDDLGWMTTPSASLSDPEAAPEDWFEEETPNEPAEAEPVEASPASSDSDAWFDEIPGDTVVEATEVVSDELWLPPELPQFSSPAATTPDQAEAETPSEVVAEEPSWSGSVDEEPVTAAADAAHESYPDTEESAPSEDFTEPTYTSWTGMPHEAKAVYATDEYDPSLSTNEAEETAADEFSQESTAEVSEPEAVTMAGDASAAPAMEAEPASEWRASETAAEMETAPFAGHNEGEMPRVLYAAPSQQEVLPPVAEAMGHTPEASIPEPTPAPFITETLAELYLQQGFRDEALSIYRQLLDRNPGDAGLKARIGAIEQRETPAPVSMSAETRAATQSVRTFFSRLARRPAVSAAATTNTSEPQPEPEVPFRVAASALANLFTASKPQPSDEGAASTLAGAFSDPAGRPSRAAERELSLDHLFRDVPPGGSQSGGVTLDEFYSTPGATGSSTEQGSEAGPEDSGGTDIRQFTAWLEGLRKK